MSEVRRSVFLERASYRRRRARDASRLLPIVGLLVFLIPGLWQSEGEIVLSDAMVFLFLAWWLAIGVAAFLARFLSDSVIGDSEGTDRDVDI